MDNRLRNNFYCGDEVDYGEQCYEQCENCNDCIGVDYGFLPPKNNAHAKLGNPIIIPAVRSTAAYQKKI